MVLETKHICKSFNEDGKKNQVLKKISIAIQEGEFVAIMGPSGCGKSTLLYSISGMDSIDSGEIRLGDKEISKCNEKELADIRRTKMGFIFQQPNLLKNLSILDNITLTAILSNPSKAEEIKQRARVLMKKAGIAELEKRDIKKVSGGQLQRAGICRALINNPRIIFGDEPTGALNSKTTAEVLKLLKSINEEGTTILLVTHDIKVAAESQRVLFMLDGEIASELRFNKANKETLEMRMKRIAQEMNKMSI